MKTRFLDLLRAAQEGSRSGVLIASLPRNDPELARAALAGGADVLKVHLNVTHNASGVRFGSLAEKAANLEAIRGIQLGRTEGIQLGKTEGIQLGEIRGRTETQ